MFASDVQAGISQARRLGHTLAVMRRWGLPVWFAGASVFCAVPAWASPDAAFCSQLKSVTSDAPDGFTAIRGDRLGLAWDDGGGDDETRYATTRSLPGALGCGVDRDHDDGEEVVNTYSCWFTAAPDKMRAVRALAAEVTGCIAGRAQISSARGKIFAAADITRKDYVISISAGAAQTVVLQISGK